MKGPAQQSKQLTLGDVAYVYQGIGTRDLKLGQEPGDGFVACWAVGASAINATSSKLDRSQYVRGAISKRLVDNALRGSGQMAKLQGQEILIANRGNYKVSNLVGLDDPLEAYHEYLPVYPAATVLVVRPKEKYEWPWRLLAFLDSPQTREILLRSASGADGEGRVITKADLEALVLPPNYQTLAERFHPKARENLERLEELESRLTRLRRAEIHAKIRRELYSPQQYPELPWLSDEVTEKIPGFNETLRKKDEVLAAHTARVSQVMVDKKLQFSASVEDAACDAMKEEYHRLDALVKGIIHDFVRAILIALRECAEFTPEQKAFAEAFKESHGFALTPESIWENPLIGRILVEPVDSRYLQHGQSSNHRMTPGVMELMGTISSKFKSVLVLNPGAGHLPAAIASKAGPFVSILTLKKNWAGAELRSFAQAYAQVGSPQAAFSYENAEEFILATERRIHIHGKRDALVLDVGTVGRLPRMLMEAIDAVSDGIDDHGTCLAYVSAAQFGLIKLLMDRVVSLTVLPPLPADPKDSNSKVLAQAFVVEIAMNKTQPRGVVAIFDATQVMPIEKVGRDLDGAVITAISKAINDDTSVAGVHRTTVKREAFVRHEEWPGLIALLGSSYDTLMTSTPETIHDERRRLECEKELLEKELLKEGDAGMVFRRMQAAQAAHADKDTEASE
jgi:hypothetical protein